MKTANQIIEDIMVFNNIKQASIGKVAKLSTCKKAMEAYAEQAVKLALEKAAEVAERKSGIGWHILAEVTPASIINEIENTVKE